MEGNDEPIMDDAADLQTESYELKIDMASPDTLIGRDKQNNPELDQSEKDAPIKRHDTFEWISLILGIATFFAALIAGISAIWLAIDTHRLVTGADKAAAAAHEDSIAALKAANEGARAALDRAYNDSQAALKQAREQSSAALNKATAANDIANDTARRQLRAYIGIRVAETVQQTDAQTYGVKLSITNDGQTPAYNSIIQTATAIGPVPLMRDFPLDNHYLPESVAGPVVSVAVINPHSSLPASVSLPGFCRTRESRSCPISQN